MLPRRRRPSPFLAPRYNVHDTAAGHAVIRRRHRTRGPDSRRGNVLRRLELEELPPTPSALMHGDFSDDNRGEQQEDDDGDDDGEDH
ncbi:hypothetical protein RRF57_010759 [Xylaria bambusicola]|uniref:Uncharacterized protein n=1 Tax=Xylaria bambusicola TaxID=326684 RepID=A0AAN7Z9P7_9PEZI